MDPAVDSFGDIAKVCMTNLARTMRVLFKEVGAGLFTGEWQQYDAPSDPKKLNRAPSIMDGVLKEVKLTLDDYREGIIKTAWLKRLIKLCLREVCEEYVRMFIAAKLDIAKVKKLPLLTNCDKVWLMSTFEAYESDRKALESEAALIDLVVTVTGDVDYLAMHYATVKKQFGPEGAAVLDRLLACRSDLSSSQRSTFMKTYHEFVNPALKSIAGGGGGGGSSSGSGGAQNSSSGKPPEPVKKSWFSFGSSTPSKPAADKSDPKKKGADEPAAQSMSSFFNS